MKSRLRVLWVGKGVTVYYQGWAQQYGEPMYSRNPKDALLMSRSGAKGAVKRLCDPSVWGVAARSEKVTT